jgi:hypothetical protein
LSGLGFVPPAANFSALPPEALASATVVAGLFFVVFSASKEVVNPAAKLLYII